MKIYIVGVGLGDEIYLTAYAKSIIENVSISLTTKRIYEKLSHLNKNTKLMEINEIVPYVIAHDNEGDIAVLASGDIGFYSIAKSLSDKLSGYEIELVSGLSSLQYFTAKLGISYDDVNVVSVHGRDKSALPSICYNKKTFLLTGGKYKASDVIEELCEIGLSYVKVTVGENLSDDSERIITGTAMELRGESFDNLSVMLIENESFIKHYEQLKDADFIRGKSPMTKEAVRILSVSKLSIEPEDIVYDIGAGTGSVAIEMARKAYKGMVYAFEKEADACALIKENIKKLGAYNVRVHNGKAPEGLENTPVPNKAFIGGSSGNLRDIVAVLRDKNPEIKLCINAITLETLTEAIAVLKENGYEADIICANISRAEKLGSYNLMKAENPIYIIITE